MTPARRWGGAGREDRLSEHPSDVMGGEIVPQTAISRPRRFLMLYSNFGVTVWKNGSFPAFSGVGGTAEPIRNQLQLVAQMAPYVRAVCQMNCLSCLCRMIAVDAGDSGRRRQNSGKLRSPSVRLFRTNSAARIPARPPISFWPSY